MNSTSGPSRPSFRLGKACSLLVASTGLCSAACGPGVATPIPEPPTLRLASVGPAPEGMVGVASGEFWDIYGLSGAAPPGAVVRCTNLDSADPISATSVRDDGSFMLTMRVSDTEELRFDWLRGAERGAPQDAYFLARPPSFQLQPSPRFECLRLAPAPDFEFVNGASQSLELSNDCAQAVQLARARFRVGAPGFELQTPLPLRVAPNERVTLALGFSRSDSAAREDTLEFDVTLAEETIRYAITLRAPSQP